MKRAPIVAFLAALSGLFFAPVAGATLIYVGNHSKEIPQVDVDRALPAFQTAIRRDFAPVWGTDAVLTTDPAAEPIANMVMYLADDPDCWGCLAYHDVILRRPTSYIWADLSEQYGESWQLSFTHELFEMLVDPWINRFAIFNNRTWLVEVADQVEDGSYAYKIDGVVISDWIYPKWFDGRLKGPIDFTHGLKRPGQVGRHGYASFHDGNGWHQITG